MAAFRDECLKNKEEIQREQEEANNDLQAALPYLREAEDAVKSITAKDIVELKTMKTPSDIIRLVFDGVLILLQNRLAEVRAESKVINKKQIDFIHDSFDESAKAMMADVHFLSNLFDFSRVSSLTSFRASWLLTMCCKRRPRKLSWGENESLYFLFPPRLIVRFVGIERKGQYQ